MELEQETNLTAEGRRNTKLARIDEATSKAYPDSYLSNTVKENLCIEYAKNFQTQFSSLFPERPTLFLSPKNECSMPKFVCTTIRRTQLPYLELYNYPECASFFANYLNYEPLADPLKLPEYLPSPAFTLESRAGDSFDLSILLTSFLIGAGYDAYCVVGSAPKWICLKDQSMSSCPFLEDERSKVQTQAKSIPGSDIYKRQVFEMPQSKYLEMMKDRKAKQALKKDARDETAAAPSSLEDKSDDKPDSPLYHKRYHSWVLLLPGKRDVEYPVFIEPSTGRSYSPETAPYFYIDSIFNTSNYWVNMNLGSSVSSLSFDLDKAEKWESVFIIQVPESTIEADDFNLDIGGKAKDQEVEKERILDVPVSWVNRLIISKPSYHIRFGKVRCQQYSGVKYEVMPEFSQSEGIVSRITLFSAEDHARPCEIRDSFAHRSDLLIRRIRDLAHNRTTEFFEEGRPYGLIKFEYTGGEQRICQFNPHARLDGLVERVEILGVKIIEHYQNRSDHLIYRSATLGERLKMTPETSLDPFIIDLEDAGERFKIRSMTEKFERDESIPVEKDVRRRKFLTFKNQIEVMYQFQPFNITCAYRVFDATRKPTIDDNNVIVHSVDKYSKKPSLIELVEQYNCLVQAQTDCHKLLVEMEREMVSKLIRQRDIEECGVTLEDTLFEVADKMTEEELEGGSGREVESVADTANLDYLAPFLYDIENPNDMSAEEQLKVKSRCIDGLKARQKTRLDIITARLNEQNEKLAKETLATQRNPGAQINDKFEEFCRETMFRISILDERIAQNRSERPAKMDELIAKMKADKRLSKAFK